MLNTFPDLLTYSQLAPFILRVILGVIIIDLGILKFKGEKRRWMQVFGAFHLKPVEFFVSLFGIIDIIGGLMLLVGIWTQIAALVFVILLGTELYIEYKDAKILKRDITFYILVASIALSLLLTGAGAFAFDIPL